MITADTITDEQIRDLKWSAERAVSRSTAGSPERDMAFDTLLCSSNALYRNTDTSDGNGSHRHWRARCAEILNARAAGAL